MLAVVLANFMDRYDAAVIEFAAPSASTSNRSISFCEANCEARIIFTATGRFRLT